MFKEIIDWIAGFFREGRKHPDGAIPPEKSLPPVHFRAVNVVEKPPNNENVEAGNLYCIVASGKPKWSLFSCPCGCGNIVTLSLQPVHNPFWKLTKTTSSRPTLHPSVWRDRGCLSHFWVKDGRIFWCADTGIHPNSRRLS